MKQESAWFEIIFGSQPYTVGYVCLGPPGPGADIGKGGKEELVTLT